MMKKDKKITKSRIEKREHKNTVKRHENGINQAFKHYEHGINQAFQLSKDSVVGKLAIKQPPKDYWLNSFKRVSDLYDDASKEDNHD